MQSRQLAAPYHLHSCRAAQQSAQLHDAHSNFKSLLCAVPSVEGSKKAAISLLTYAQQTTGCTVPPNYHQRIVICKMSLAHAKPLHVSAVLCLPACLCVSPQRPVARPPTGTRQHYEDECYHKQRLSAKLKGEDPGKGSGKGGGKGNGNDSGKGKSKGRGQGQDKVKVDEEEALTASQTRTTRTRTRTEATPTLIQGGTPSPLEGSLVLPHAHKRRPSENKGPSGRAKVVMTATLRREAVS